jgi:hypothetical protein
MLKINRFVKSLFQWDIKMPDVVAIPTAHSLTHNRLCQSMFSTLFAIGNGLSCGEEIETLWSVLKE